jgi:hypothetical protein
MSPMLQFLLLLATWLIAGAVTLAVGWYGIGFVLFPLLYWALVLRGSADRAQVADQKLQSTLMKHENVIASGLQLRVGALLSRRILIALTSSRVVIISRSLLGGFTMRDHQWKDLHDATLSENILPAILGSKLGFAVGTDGQQSTIDALPSDVAARMYAHAQSEEQAWEEKQRVRGLEEKRATSGGVIVGAATGAGGASNSASMLEDLDRAKKLFDSGAISDAEYQELKSKILNRQAF